MTSEPAGDHKYENAFSNEGSAPYATKRIDNTNAVAIALTSTSGRLYAGYNDIGVWLSTNSGYSWTKRTPAAHSSGYGGNVSSLIYLGSASGNDSLYATMSVTHEADSLGKTKYRYYLWRSLDGGASWTGHGDLPGGWLAGLTRDQPTGKMWCTSDGMLYSSTNSGSTWNAVTPSGLPTDGLYTIAAYAGNVYAGGWNKLWVSTNNGTTFTEVNYGGGTNFDYSSAKGDVGTDLNHFQWNGIHQVLINKATSEVWVTSYAGYNYNGNAGKGLFRGTLGGSTLTRLVDAKLYRGVAQDSCDMRIHVTSGEPATNGANDGAVIAAAKGKVIYRLSGGIPPGTFNGNVTDDPLDRFPFGAGVVADGAGKIYASVPGYGIVVEDLSVEGICENEFHGGGEDMRLREPPVEEATLRHQTHFTLAEVRIAKLSLYDLAGRKIVSAKPGVYFERVEVTPKQYRLRTLIVTP